MKTSKYFFRSLILIVLAACSSAPKPQIKTPPALTDLHSCYVPPHSYYYFHNMDKLGFQLDWIRRSGPVYPLQEPKEPFTVNYTYQGQTHTLEDYYQRNAVLGFLILKDNQILSERYFHDSDQNSRFLSMSVQKSMTSTLFGVALEEGKIDHIEDPVTKYLPDLSESGYNRVNLKQLLMMATGIAENESSLDPHSPLHPFNIVALHGTPSFYDYIKSLRPSPTIEPGTVFNYQSINTEVLGLVIEKATGMPLNEYMTEKLWSKIGAQSDSFIFRAKKQLNQGAYGCLCATLRDYGRFGLMMMNGGTLGGARILSPRWISEATTPAQYSVRPPSAGGYGYQWWVPANKDGAYQVTGLFGQLVYINPAKRIVIVVTSAWPPSNNNERWDEMEALVNAIADNG